nr:preprotein translocase subunit SecE [uncultured Kingella sp.]
MNKSTHQKNQSGFNLFRYIKDSVAEIKKVVWPSRNDTVRMTMFVIAFTCVFTIFIYGVDTLIGIVFNYILVKG